MAEEDYFARIEQEKKARLTAEARNRKAAEEREARKALHWNKCGKCGADLKAQAFRGVEIDVCPECGAVLLDQGELESLSGQDKSGVFKTLAELFHVKRETP